MLRLAIFLSLLGATLADLNNPTVDNCYPRRIDGDNQKIVCVCDTSNCGELKFNWPQRSGEGYLVQTTKSGKRFSVGRLDELDKFEAGSDLDKIHVNTSIRHQKILGWGGAFTDAATHNINSLPAKLADKLMASYYGHDGLQYNFGRVPMGGSDFSSRVYSYDDVPDDFNLTHWQLAREDLQLKIPYLKRAHELAQSSNDDLKLFGSPWSPPAWMKTNHNFVRGRLINTDKIYRAYAEYFANFFDAYEEHGLKFWGATVQNEPVAANLFFYSFNSLQFSEDDMIKFIADYLGPALARRGRTKENFKLMVGDESLGLINMQAANVLKDEGVQKYVSGLAFHWYTSGLLPYSLLDRLYNQVKDKIEFMIMSEACTGSPPSWRRVIPGSWSRGVSYAKDIVEDLVRQTSAWIDWNLALDMHGGPNWANNFVDSPILVDSEKGEFYKQPMYYSLAHFSRFFRPNSVRVESSVIIKNGGLMSVAALKEDSGHVVVYLLNDSNRDRKIDLNVFASTNETLSRKFVIESNSFNTVIIKL